MKQCGYLIKDSWTYSDGRPDRSGLYEEQTGGRDEIRERLYPQRGCGPTDRSESCGRIDEITARLQQAAGGR